MKTISLAVAALLGLVEGLNIKAYQGIGDQVIADNYNSAEVLSEANRFVNAKGEPIILAEQSGHARIELTQVKKYKNESSLLQTAGDDEETDTKHKKCTAEDLKGDGHCPSNHKGP
jgi:hypothetical protein